MAKKKKNKITYSLPPGRRYCLYCKYHATPPSPNWCVHEPLPQELGKIKHRMNECLFSAPYGQAEDWGYCGYFEEGEYDGG